MEKFGLLIWFVILLVLANMVVIISDIPRPKNAYILGNVIGFFGAAYTWAIFPYTDCPDNHITESPISLFISRTGGAIVTGASASSSYSVACMQLNPLTALQMLEHPESNSKPTR